MCVCARVCVCHLFICCCEAVTVDWRFKESEIASPGGSLDGRRLRERRFAGAGNVSSPSLCAPTGPPLAPPAAAPGCTRRRLLPWPLARKSQRSPQTERAPRLFAVTADLNASLQGPPTRCFKSGSRVRCLAPSRTDNS